MTTITPVRTTTAGSLEEFLAQLGPEAVVGVYRGFDAGSRAAAREVTAQVAPHVGRVVQVVPVSVPDPAWASEELLERARAQVPAVDALVDSCPAPRREAEFLARILDVPLHVAGQR